MKPVTLLVLGAGSRGEVYAGFAEKFPKRAKVVGVAEPRDFYRETMASKHGIPKENVFTDWRQAAQRRRFADGVVISTQDAVHTEPAIAFAKLGYNILLEKPMAPTAPECRRIVQAVKKAGVIFAVGHVLRYTNLVRMYKKLLAGGLIGDIATIQMLENVTYWHQAHSFVRGNWRNEKESSFMLLAKSCHYLDLIRYLMNKRCVSVASYGSLFHFRKENRPKGAAARCMDCGVERDCPYSAPRFYLGRVRKGQVGWPVDILTPDRTIKGVTEAMRAGPYGRCVYACDNDVVDNQVVILNFEDGTTANFVMTAFTPNGVDIARTRIFGTRGWLFDKQGKIQHDDFLTDKTKMFDPSKLGKSIGGHGGGDGGLMDAFVSAVGKGDPSPILSGPDETLETHLIVFAAEQSRREGRVITVK